MMDTFHLYLPTEDKEITESFLETVSVSIAMTSPYIILNVSLVDINEALTNIFKVGTPLMLLAEINDATYKMTFKLLSCNRSEGNLPSTVGYLDLVFVSSWYFDLRKGAYAYYGTPSSILGEVFDGNETYTLDIDESSNYPKVFYRQGMTMPEFIEYFTNYGYKGGYPLMLYTDVGDFIKYKSVADIYESEPSYYLLQNGGNINGKDLRKVIAPLSLVFSTDATTSHCVTDYEFITDNFIGNLLSSPFTIGNVEIEDEAVDTYTQMNKKFFNWNVSPTDAMGSSIRDSFLSNLSTFGGTALLLGWTDKLMVGQKCSLLSSAKVGEDETVAGEGDYMVMSITYMYNTKDQIPRTTATFSKIIKQ